MEQTKRINVTTRKAKQEDVKELCAIINDAYRSTGGWTGIFILFLYLYFILYFLFLFFYFFIFFYFCMYFCIYFFFTKFYLL